MKVVLRFLCVLVSLTGLASAGVFVSAPTNNSNVATTVQYVAKAQTSCSKGISGMGIYTAPGKLAYLVHASSLNTLLKFSPGTYNTVVQEWDKCGWTSKTAVTIHVGTSGSSSAVPRSNHVWIITEENRSYESVIGSKYMPYYNSLASKYALASQYYANRHSSLPALMWLVAGQDVTTNNNTTSCFNVDNVVRHLLFRGMTWKTYQEDMPWPGFTGLSWANYVRRHNPLIDFTDVCAPSQKYNSVPYTQLAKDISNHATPNYVYITPNLQHDAHDGSRAQADAWLAKEVPKILALPEFQSGGDGLLFIAWDEGSLSPDNRCNAWTSNGCGGRVATVLIGPKVKRNFKSQVLYHHQNLLRTVCDALGFGACPGAGANAAPMSDFF
jgi:phosphatidylinositol-3-phosphatase